MVLEAEAYDDALADLEDPAGVEDAVMGAAAALEGSGDVADILAAAAVARGA